MIVNAVITVAVLTLVAAVALVVRAPAPPGIAEFAPQATKPIQKAPPGQAGRFGSGDGACGAGQRCANGPGRARGGRPQAVVARGGAPSALQCFTWPDGAVTQTFDPQSPPCIASWNSAAGNGGATTAGVTSSEIRLAFPTSGSSSQTPANLQPLVDFFNTRFELYGRHIVLAPFASNQAAAGSTVNPEDERADAEQAAALHPFAALEFADPGSNQTGAEYLDGLAERRIVSVAGGEIAPLTTSAALVAHAPYEWSYLPTATDLLGNVATLSCRQLTGRDAAYAPTYRNTLRKFAILLPDAAALGEQMPGVPQLLDTLAGCGIKKPPVIYYSLDERQQSAINESMLQFKQDGVTSILFYPEWGQGNPNAPQVVANSINYQPEWVTMGWFNYVVAALTAGSPAELQSTFGIAEWNKMVALAQEPWYQAFVSAGGSSSKAGSLLNAEEVYHDLLILASGIQMAGPRLTPRSFANSLDATTFPNPGAATAPSYQATVGFAKNRHEMIDDDAAFWFDPSATSAATVQEDATQADNTTAEFCYAGLGARWTQATWPAKDQFYKGGCR